jgi:hypothetical protein
MAYINSLNPPAGSVLHLYTAIVKTKGIVTQSSGKTKAQGRRFSESKFSHEILA